MWFCASVCTSVGLCVHGSLCCFSHGGVQRCSCPHVAKSLTLPPQVPALGLEKSPEAPGLSHPHQVVQPREPRGRAGRASRSTAGPLAPPPHPAAEAPAGHGLDPALRTSLTLASDLNIWQQADKGAAETASTAASSPTPSTALCGVSSSGPCPSRPLHSLPQCLSAISSRCMTFSLVPPPWLSLFSSSSLLPPHSLSDRLRSVMPISLGLLFPSFHLQHFSFWVSGLFVPRPTARKQAWHIGKVPT